MGQLEAINLLKRISVDKIKASAAARRATTDKRALPRLSHDYMDAMFDRSERVSAKQAAQTT